MRIIAATLLLISELIFTVIGVLYVMSSSYEKFEVKTDVGDLSEIRSQEAATKIGPAGQQEKVIGGTILAGAFLLLVSSIVCFTRLFHRMRLISLGAIILSGAVVGGGIVIGGAPTWGLIGLGVLVLSLPFVLLGKPPTGVHVH
jgi:hypothetical protein